ncbi:MAG: DUF3499 family protein [Nitriliruptoraceae bacterium]
MANDNIGLGAAGSPKTGGVGREACRTTSLCFTVRAVDTSSASLPPRPGSAHARRPSRSRERGVLPFPVRGERVCARPSCTAHATATLSFSYAERRVDLDTLFDEPRPQTYDLCPTHAARTRPPYGWDLRDRRPEDERLPDRQPRVPADLGGDRTVAVLAAALRAVPSAVSEDARSVPTAEIPPVPPAPPAPPRPAPRPVPAAEHRGA